MNNEKINSKIRALLAKTVENGATEFEAEQALKAAARLMAQHNLMATGLSMVLNQHSKQFLKMLVQLQSFWPV